MAMDFTKYKPFPKVDLPNRAWPEKVITKAPRWCSVDLRDGNQALPIPMGVEEKLALYEVLIKMGFKEIEVGFPSASETEYRFLRTLVEKDLIPDDVTIQVLTQAREHLIKKTFDSLKGVKNAIIHVYNSTSTLQRKVVFRKNKDEIKAIALEGVRLIKEMAKEAKKEGTNISLEYSAESFTGTELEYALEVCNGVLEEWQPSKDNKVIINLPSTVEMAMPNIYADQIEWISTHIDHRENVLISLHAHNDRGTGIAATELGLLAGADRVEGTLFGNGERTGNTDILTVAMNLYSQGIDPELDIYDVNEIKEVYEKSTRLFVNARHPYVGELVHTAFSGSHQDAINKGINYSKENNIKGWEVPYLPIDPADVGLKYEAVIRINSQSGKGGIAFILENEYGFKLPKVMHPDFSKVVQKYTDSTGEELSKETIYELFEKTYLNVEGDLELLKYKVKTGKEQDSVEIKGEISLKNEKKEVKGIGNGPLSAYIDALMGVGLPHYSVTTYEQHARGEGEKSISVAYVEVLSPVTCKKTFAIGLSANITSASLQALNSAINRNQNA